MSHYLSSLSGGYFRTVLFRRLPVLNSTLGYLDTGRYLSSSSATRSSDSISVRKSSSSSSKTQCTQLWNGLLENPECVQGPKFAVLSRTWSRGTSRSRRRILKSRKSVSFAKLDKSRGLSWNTTETRSGGPRPYDNKRDENTRPYSIGEQRERNGLMKFVL